MNNHFLQLYIARRLIVGEPVPTKEELEFVLPRIEFIIHKLSKARDKYEMGSGN